MGCNLSLNFLPYHTSRKEIHFKIACRERKGNFLTTHQKKIYSLKLKYHQVYFKYPAFGDRLLNWKLLLFNTTLKKKIKPSRLQKITPSASAQDWNLLLSLDWALSSNISKSFVVKGYTEIPGPPGASERHLFCQSGKMSAVYPDLLNFPARPAACGQFLAWSEAVVPGRSGGSPPEQDRKVRKMQQ